MITTKKFSEHAGVIDMRLATTAGAAKTVELTEAAQAMFPSMPVVHTKRTEFNRDVWIASTRKLNSLEHGVLSTAYFMHPVAEPA
jgi:hypothetical protein